MLNRRVADNLCSKWTIVVNKWKDNTMHWLHFNWSSLSEDHPEFSYLSGVRYKSAAYDGRTSHWSSSHWFKVDKLFWGHSVVMQNNPIQNQLSCGIGCHYNVNMVKRSLLSMDSGNIFFCCWLWLWCLIPLRLDYWWWMHNMMLSHESSLSWSLPCFCYQCVVLQSYFEGQSLKLFSGS